MAYARLKPDERRSQLVELGMRMFIERPYDSFSMDDVATEAGISKGLIYHYFPSKRDFYVAVLREAAADILQLTEPDNSLPPGERIRVAATNFLDYVRQSPEAYLAVVRGGIGSDPEVAAVAEEVRQVLMQRVLDGLDIGEPPATIVMAIRAWIGFAEAACLEWLSHEMPMEEPDFIQYLINILQAALRSP
jgi:AcrR family transcriptional regulator